MINKNRLFIIFIIFISIFLRLNLVFTQQFSYDERFTYFHASKNSYLGHFLHPQDDRPPLYYFLTKLVLNFDSSEEALRFPSLVFSVLSAFFIYKTFCFFSKKVGQYSLIIYSVHPLLIHISWQTRDYSLLFMLSAAMVYFLVRILHNLFDKNTLKKNDLVFLVITTSLGLLTTYLFYAFSFAIILSFLLLLFIFRKEFNFFYFFKNFLITMSIPLGIGMYYLLDGYNRIITYNFISTEIFDDMYTKLFLELFSFSGYWILIQDRLVPTICIFLLILLSFFYYSLSKEHNYFQRVLFLFFHLSLLVLVSIYLIISNFIINLLLPRGLVVFVPLIIFIIIFGILSLEILIKKYLPIKDIKKFILIVFLTTGLLQYGVRYGFFNIDYQDWIWPSPNQRVMTDLIQSSLYCIDESTYIINFPAYDQMIFDYELRGIRDFSKHNKLNLPRKKDNSSYYLDENYIPEVFFKNNLFSGDKILVVVDSYLENNNLDIFKDDYSVYEDSLLNYLNNNCEKSCVHAIEKSNYRLWKCSLKSID